MLLGALAIEGGVGARDRMAQRHLGLRQSEDDQCNSCGPPFRIHAFRRREGPVRRLMDITPELPGTGNCPHWPPWRAAGRRDCPAAYSTTPAATLVMPFCSSGTGAINRSRATHPIAVRHVVHCRPRNLFECASRGNAPSPLPVPPPISRALRRGGLDVRLWCEGLIRDEAGVVLAAHVRGVRTGDV